MMHSVQISSQLYENAKRVAEANGLSIEEFIADAVQLHLHDEPDSPDALQLTPDQVAAIKQAQSEVKGGKFLSLDEVDEQSAAYRAEWLQENQP